MFKQIIQFGIANAIINHLLSAPAGLKTKILEIGATGDFAKLLVDAGFVNYHGTVRDKSAMTALKKTFKGSTAKFTNVSSTDPAAFDVDHDVVVCLHGTPYETTPAGTKMIVLTSGFADHGSLCLALTGLFVDGATTIQHGNLFVTYGTRA